MPLVTPLEARGGNFKARVVSPARVGLGLWGGLRLAGNLGLVRVAKALRVAMALRVAKVMAD